MEAVGAQIEFIDYGINSLSRGKGSLGKVTAQIRCDDQLFSGKAIEQDVMRASALALINAVNKMLLNDQLPQNQTKSFIMTPSKDSRDM